MKFDIGVEMDKLNYLNTNSNMSSFKNYRIGCVFLNIKIKYLLYVLELTYDYPQVETYLKRLLVNFTVEELNKFGGGGYTILHQMVLKPSNISLNSFEIIINFGINVNSQTKYGCTSLHFMYNGLLKHKQNIIGLFVEHGANLNILNRYRITFLDDVVCFCESDEDSKIIIMTLMDFGARLNNRYKSGCCGLSEFIESYCLSSIKPAIKNEIKI